MGRTVWIREGDAEGRIEPGNVVTAARELNDFCLRGDDGSEPIAVGAALQIVETRGWGAAMAEELPALSAETDPESREADTAAVDRGRHRARGAGPVRGGGAVSPATTAQWEVTAYDDDGARRDMEPARDYADAWRIALRMFESTGNATVAIDDHTGMVRYRITPEPPEDKPAPRKPRTPVHIGDRVRDPLDGEWREVVAVTGLAVRFADGGTMGIREAQEADKLLPSEACRE